MRPDIKRALIAFTVLVILGLFAASAFAGDWRRPVNGWWPTGAKVYIGANWDLDGVGGGTTNPYCFNDDRPIGEFGGVIPIYRQGRHGVTFKGSHYSCATEELDEASSNVGGVFYEFLFW